MILYFLRHAEAEDDAASDDLRRLTAKGLEQATKVGKFCHRLGLVPDLIVSSPVVRAKQTAEVIAKSLDVDLVEERWLACGMSFESCLRGLAPYSSKNSVMIVGHEPDFSAAVAMFLGFSHSGSMRIRKASLTAIDLSRIAAGEGQLQFSLPPRLM